MLVNVLVVLVLGDGILTDFSDGMAIIIVNFYEFSDDCNTSALGFQVKQCLDC